MGKEELNNLAVMNCRMNNREIISLKVVPWARVLTEGSL